MREGSPALATQQTTAVDRYRRPRGQHPRPRRDVDEKTVEQLPEYLDAHEIDALIRAAPNPRARLLFLIGVASRAQDLRGAGGGGA